jgi:hypothetical protein
MKQKNFLSNIAICYFFNIVFLMQPESRPPTPPPALVLSVNVDERDLEGVESLGHASREEPPT